MKTILLISMIAFTSAANACKMTSLQASQAKLTAATEYVMGKYSLSEQSIMEMKSVRNTIYDTIVQIQFNYEKPSITEYIVTVEFTESCRTIVNEVPVFFP